MRPTRSTHIRDGHAYDLRHQNVPCAECDEGAHMVLVVLDPTTHTITHTEGVLASTCEHLPPEGTARRAMRMLAARLGVAVAVAEDAR